MPGQDTQFLQYVKSIHDMSFRKEYVGSVTKVVSDCNMKRNTKVMNQDFY